MDASNNSENFFDCMRLRFEKDLILPFNNRSKSSIAKFLSFIPLISSRNSSESIAIFGLLRPTEARISITSFDEIDLEINW